MPGTSRVVWNGRKVFATTRLQAKGRLQVGARTAREDLRRLVGTPYPPASTPGTPPHRRTGRLQRSVFSEVRERAKSISVYIGARAPYAGYLQRGTRRMAARPFLPSRLAAGTVGRGVFRSIFGRFRR